MELNQELLTHIKIRVAEQFECSSWHQVYMDFEIEGIERYWLEVCRRYSEELIKCDECSGSGEREINVDGMDGPTTCIFCEGKGYQE